MKSKIFKSDRLPFIELRYVSKVVSCDKMHQHDALTISGIKSGQLNIEFNEKKEALKPNSISIINPGLAHRATMTTLETKESYVLFLGVAWCRSLQNTLLHGHADYAPVNITLLDDQDVFCHFMTMCDTLLSSECSLLEKEEKVVNFATPLFLNFCDNHETNNIDIDSQALALKIEAYIVENLENELLLGDIADAMHLSIAHILRVFKKEFGLPIHSYIINKKVHLAKELLSRNLSVSEAAQMSGFFDQSHLNRLFKRVFQLTPREYQKNLFS
ncbi:AraC family transcriptional regulator [Sulfurimonas sp. HSL1-6]|uniref:AraC family transcriptional regulator n=1 Tax=Thiomicrolovo immobilis TaxID=3131935 RepID=UPI0031F7D9FC